MHDLFFAQGYIAAADRLFQIDLWRRAGTGKLAEVLGPSAIERDSLARAVNFRGDWNAEWAAYGPDAQRHRHRLHRRHQRLHRGLDGKLPARIRRSPDTRPGLWVPEDCLSRVAGLTMTRNLTREVTHAAGCRSASASQALRKSACASIRPCRSKFRKGLDLADITGDILRAYREATGAVRLTTEQGSNNWVVDGTMTATGRPMLANDPHRPVQLPSLRKTVHLVGPGWNAIGAGEPALPGIALGHNENIAFGFTIVGIDQQDLYVETVNPANPAEYRYRGEWKKFETEQQQIAVKGQAARTVTLRYTVHGPVIYEDARAPQGLCAALGGQRTGHGGLHGRPRAGPRPRLERIPRGHGRATRCPARTWSTPTRRATSAGRWAA